jgi:hypothetical protein
MRTVSKIACILSIVLVGGLPAQPQPGRGKRQDPKPKPCPAATGEPLNLAQVIESLNAPDLKRCLAGFVEKRGVKFLGTPLVIETLKDLDAPPELFPLIPEPPPPPKPVLAGPLTVTCDPANCEILVNDRYQGEAIQGKKTIEGLEAGPASIRVIGAGHESETRRVDLAAGAAHAEQFNLRPIAIVRKVAGRELLDRVVRALGGVEGLATMAAFDGSGSVSVKEADGEPQEWTMTFTQRWDAVTLRLTSKKGECNPSIHTGAAEGNCKGKLRGSPEEIQAARIALSFQRSQIGPALGRLMTVSVAPAEGLPAPAFQFDAGGQAYRVTMSIANGEESLPLDLVYRPAKDAAPAKSEYSNYMKVEGTRFPGKIAMTESDDGKPRSTVFVINRVMNHESAPPPKKGR